MMDQQTRNSAIAAFLILAGVGLVAYFLPALMLAAIEISPIVAGILAGLFLLAFFLIFWLRQRVQNRRPSTKL